jgi:hypothetical protein
MKRQEWENQWVWAKSFHLLKHIINFQAQFEFQRKTNIIRNTTVIQAIKTIRFQLDREACSDFLPSQFLKLP